MLLTTRRRMMGLAAAAFGARLLPPLPASAQDDPSSDSALDENFDAPEDAAAGDETPQCFATKEFAPWMGKASNERAGAGIGEVEMTTPCDFFWTSIDVSENFEAKISIVAGDAEGASLEKAILLKEDHRLVVRDANDKVLGDVPLCGVCTDLQQDEFSIVLPLEFAPYLREEKSLSFGIKMGDEEDCRFTVPLDPMRQALTWASEQRDKLQTDLDEGKCEQPQGCFLTTACCGALGLPDDCFELTTLRRYRDQILSRTPEGRRAIAAYYDIAPAVLQRLDGADEKRRLVRLYWRYVLPSAIAAKLKLNGLTFRIYSDMMAKLARDLLPASSR
ncbi:CFI-box-CTERM domain-containing protein [Methyloligella solikamskensis]|uniref:CFI-box-CTERM domain-containing protein n=1 Tax=Methyloligella solikamskensis TaxID=1177756 RepID=A0ABW3JAR5_9HYPH